MSKVYGIFYDNQGNVMIGAGGQVGHQSRMGYHLPGGTAKRKGKSVNLSSNEVMATLWRELREEFGNFRADECSEHLERQGATHIYNMSLGEHRVYFVLCEVPVRALNRLYGRINDAEVTDPNDTPFQTCEVWHRDRVVNEFSSCGNDWLVRGLMYMRIN